MRWNMHVACGAVAAVLSRLTPVPLAAQEPITVAPKLAATEFLDAATASDWATVIRLTDGQSLWEYVTLQRDQFRTRISTRPDYPTVASYLKSDSTMPRVVAEWFVTQNRRAVRDTSFSMLSFMFADITRQPQLDSLSDEEFYARQLKAKQFSYQVDLALRRSGCKGPFPPTPNPKRRVRGVAMLSETEAVALYQEQDGFSGTPTFGGEYAQLKLRRTGSGWRALASDEVLGRNSGSIIGTDGACPRVPPPPR